MKTAQELLNEATKEQKRRDELRELFYPSPLNHSNLLSEVIKGKWKKNEN